MKNKVESLKRYDSIEASDDVIKLLNGLKEMTFKTHNAQYGYWTICQTMRKVLTMRQQDNEPLAEYYKRFTSCVHVAESHWGTLVPTVAATNETYEKTSRDKFITCIFSCRSGDKKYERLITKLNSAYVAGQNNYPKTVESAVLTMLTHYMNDKGVHMTDEEKGQRDQKGFMHKHHNVTCYKCGKKKGHYANKCPSGTAMTTMSCQLDQIQVY
jgi:predicted ATP-binding protein involved in virulence